jgi:thiamine biosynthesis protein ThiI
MQYSVILIRYGELSLKSAYVRKYFESILIRNINQALTHEKIQGEITKDRGRIYLYTDNIVRSNSMLRRIFGIVSVSPAIETTARLEDISTIALQFARVKLTKDKSFAIRASRTGIHPFTSQDIAVKIGNEIVHEIHAPVDLTNPDIELFIEVRNKKAFLFTEKIRGVGGLPRGTQGTVLALIDTPGSLLAAWYLMHRGCDVVFVITQKTNEKLLNNFLERWNMESENILIHPDTRRFYDTIVSIAEEHHGEAVIIGCTLEKPLSTLSLITKWKQHSTIPMLTPLIAMNEKEIRTRCRKQGIHL